jgi:hypothetical protein
VEAGAMQPAGTPAAPQALSSFTYSWVSIGGDLRQASFSWNMAGKGMVVAVGRDGAVYYNRVTPISGQPADKWAWSGWQSLAHQAKQVVVVENADHGFDVFIIGKDNAVWNRRERRDAPGVWTAWQRLGGNVTQIAVALDGVQCLEVFGIGSGQNHALWNIHQTSPGVPSVWSNWRSLGGTLKQIAVRRVGALATLEVFAIASNNVVSHRWQTTINAIADATWSAWQSLGGCAKQIAVGSIRAGTDLFMIGSDNAVWYKRRPSTSSMNTWTSQWQPLGGYATQIDASNGVGIAAIGAGNTVYFNEWQKTNVRWSGWNSLNKTALQLCYKGIIGTDHQGWWLNY